jgi:DNA-binding LytR/AlgR family response regulator
MAALVAAIPGTIVAITLQTAFGRAPVLSTVELARIYVSVTVVIALVALPLRALGTRRRQQQQAAPASDRPASAAPTGNPFLRRIPERLGTDLLFIATEDHYLRVTTDRGSDLILFRLSDAVAELDPALGQQVHRSYWVAWGAVASVLRDGHRTVLVLTNGAKVPVSRPYARALRKSGRLGR